MKNVAREIGALAVSFGTLILVGIIGMNLSACAWMKSETKVAEVTAVDCAKADVADLVTQVATILASGNYAAGLDALAAKVGTDAVACTVKTVIAVAEAANTSAAGSASPASAAPKTSEMAPTAARGQSWIAGKGIRFTK